MHLIHLSYSLSQAKPSYMRVSNDMETMVYIYITVLQIRLFLILNSLYGVSHEVIGEITLQKELLERIVERIVV